MLDVSKKQARRIALAAQGFLDPRHTTPTMRTFARTLERTGVLQVDSVNVLQRAHYMPLFSRMGAYDPALLTRAAEKKPRRLVEYWAHVQALMPVELWPVMQHRMASYREQRGKWWQEVDDDLAERLLAGSPPAARARRASSTTVRRATSSTGAGTGRRPRRRSTSSTCAAIWPSRGATASSR